MDQNESNNSLDEQNKTGEIEQPNAKNDLPSQTSNEPLDPITNNPVIPPTIIPEPQAKEMEVHHHTHTARKRFKHYFFEFFMLFLAVFCGFLAENIREHYVENHRVKEYAIALVDDLKEDKKEIITTIADNEIILACFDSISRIVHNLKSIDRVPGSFYLFSRVGSTSSKISWNRAALTQIIQSGSLRYFKNVDLINKISSYYAASNHIMDMNENDKKYRDKTLELRSRLLNNYHFNQYSQIILEDRGSWPDSLMHNEVPLQVNDPELLNEYVNSFHNRRATLKYLSETYLPQAVKTADDLITMLNKEYGLQ
jgi:hypothetical protein